MIAPPRFTLAEAQAHADAWGFNCGPAAACAMLGMTPAEIRPFLADFERKGYTNPMLMRRILKNLQATYHWQVKPDTWPRRGLVRIQWHGPWDPYPRQAARQTHWVGAMTRETSDIGIFDVNALANGSGWVSLTNWQRVVVPYILKHAVSDANGQWSLTHAAHLT